MKNIWPIAIIAFFAVFMASLVGFAIWSGSQRTDLVSAGYYDEEIGFQKHMEAGARARDAGWIPQVQLESVGRSLAVRFASVPAVDQGTVTLYRPSEAELDRTLDFKPDAAGVQLIDAAGLKPGLWRVKIAWTAHGEPYFAEGSVMVPP